MNKNKPDRWHGLSPETQAALAVRDYGVRSLAERIAEVGVEAGQLTSANRTDPEVARAWIPGVEIFARTIHPQRHRGLFGEFARRDEGTLARIGLLAPTMVGRPDVRPDCEGFSYPSAKRAEGTLRLTNGSGVFSSMNRRIFRFAATKTSNGT